MNLRDLEGLGAWDPEGDDDPIAGLDMVFEHSRQPPAPMIAMWVAAASYEVAHALHHPPASRSA